MNIIKYGKSGFGAIDNLHKAIIAVDATLFSVFEIKDVQLSKTNAKKSIPFMLEPQLLDDIDELEFIINKINDGFNVVVIKKQILEQLKQEIKEHNIDAIGAYPEFMLLPHQAEKITYTDTGGLIVFRKSNINGGAMQKELFFQLFDGEDIIVADKQADDYQVLNLLQYDINEVWKKILQPYWKIITVFIVAFILHITTLAIQNHKDAITITSLEQQNAALFSQLFPDVKQIVDIRVQTEQKMNNLAQQQQLSSNDFLTVLLRQDFHNTTINSLRFDKTLEVK
jgi:type II secretory pathway component PulL